MNWTGSGFITQIIYSSYLNELIPIVNDFILLDGSGFLLLNGTDFLLL